MKDASNTIFLREYLVMLLLLLNFLDTFIRERVISSLLCHPELLLVSHLDLKVLPVRLDNRIVHIFTEIFRLISHLVMRFEQVRHLMQNAEAHIIVRLNRLVALRDRISERFKVHT